MPLSSGRDIRAGGLIIGVCVGIVFGFGAALVGQASWVAASITGAVAASVWIVLGANAKRRRE